MNACERAHKTDSHVEYYEYTGKDWLKVAFVHRCNVITYSTHRRRRVISPSYRHRDRA